MLRFFKNRRAWRFLLLTTVCVLFGPFLYSRVVANYRGAEVELIEIEQRTDRATKKIAESGQIIESASQNSLQTLRADLSLVAYNIAHGRGLSESNWTGETRQKRLQRLDAIAALLAQIDADVVVLNEVDFDSSWSHHVDQARYISEKAGYPYAAKVHNLDFRVLGWTWRFGNAVLSKHPIGNASVVDLPCYATWEAAIVGKKRALRCEIESPQGSFAVIATHLSHRSEAVRAESADVLSSEVSGSKLPTVLAGDFNSAPTGFPHSTKDAEGQNAIEVLSVNQSLSRIPAELPDSFEFTFSSNDPQQVIDWFFIPSDWSVVDYSVTKSGLSDHRPIHTTVRH